MERTAHISLDTVLEDPVGFDFQLPFSLEALDREPLLDISPVHLSGAISRIERGFAMDGEVAFEARLECSRCLAPYPFELAEPFSLVLYRRVETPGEEREIGRPDLDVSYFDGQTLDVSPIAEERVQLSLPMKPLCREDCAGLCPVCGGDRNLARCACRDETIDPRWNALRELQKTEKA
jgi:uncharacterized protein